MSDPNDPAVATPVAADPAAATAAPAPLELGYAPPAKPRSRAVWVILVGLLTTAAALGAQYAVAVKTGENIMGWYANYVIPAGALIVGIAASSGYALMSWYLGVRVRRGLLVTILLLLVGSYFAAQYVEFAARGPYGVPTGATGPGGRPVYRQLGFWEHFHLQAVNWAWKKKSYERRTNARGETDEYGEPLGMWGYCFVALGIVGFSAGGLILPAAVGSRAYCELCERYMTTRSLALLPASVAHRKVPKADAEGQQQLQREHDAAADAAQARWNAMTDAAARDDAAAFRAALPADATTKAARKAADKLPRRVDVTLVRCPSCAQGRLELFVVNGHGKQVARTKVGEAELTQPFVRAIATPDARPVTAA